MSIFFFLLLDAHPGTLDGILDKSDAFENLRRENFKD